MSTSLAVRHRPRRFDEVAAQPHLVAVLRAAAARRPVPPQILLAGPSGVGKTTLARVFAAALFCPVGPVGEACGECEECLAVTGPGGRHPDVIELDAASNGGVDAIRDISDRAHLAPMRAPWKVYIIDEAHGLTRDGAQAFLRTLEEPAPHTIFILATTDPQRLPDALRGRCLLCYARSPEPEDLVENLTRVAGAEGWNLPEAVLRCVVAATDPALGVRGTVTTLDKLVGHLGPDDQMPTVDQAAQLLGLADPAQFRRLVDAVVGGDVPGALANLSDLASRTGRSQLRGELVLWARTGLRACAESDPGQVPAWLARLQAFLDTTPERLELAAATAAGHCHALPAPVSEAVTRGPQAGAAPAPVPAPAPEHAPTPAPVESAGPAAVLDAAPKVTTPRRETGPARAYTAKPPAALLAQLLRQVSATDPALGVALRQCGPTAAPAGWSVAQAAWDDLSEDVQDRLEQLVLASGWVLSRR